MAPPPAKKRRLIPYSSRKTINSDDETPTSTQQSTASSPSTATNRKTNTRALLIRGQPKAKAMSNKSKTKAAVSRKDTPSASQNATLSSKNGIQKRGKSASIYSFFDAVPQSQRTNGTSKESALEDETEEEDNIEDNLSDVGSSGIGGSIHNNVVPPSKAKRVTASSQKRGRMGIAFAGKLTVERKISSSNQRFKSTVESEKGATSSKGTQTEDLRPWAEKYGPANVDELAVHKKKVADVEKWLDYAFNGRGRQVRSPLTTSQISVANGSIENVGTERAFRVR